MNCGFDATGYLKTTPQPNCQFDANQKGCKKQAILPLGVDHA
jgi:hypothetical protein